MIAAREQGKAPGPRAGRGRLASALLAATVLSTPAASGIDYEPSSLARMLGLAALVVHGEVVEVGESCIVVTVHASLGDSPHALQRIEVVRYERYDERAGPASYAPGQRFVWLLSWRSEPAVVGSEPRWHVSGAEGEGEFPVAEGSVYLREELVESGTGEERSLHGRKDRFVKYGLQTFWNAAEGYRRCVVWEPAAEGGAARTRTVCSKAELAALATRSPLHRQLIGTPNEEDRQPQF